jgi:hypothetical protein
LGTRALRFAHILTESILSLVVGDRSLDDALCQFGVSISSGLFKIEIEDDGVELRFPGLVSVPDGEGV